MSSRSVVVYVGGVAHCPGGGALEVFSGHVAVENGKILSAGPSKNIQTIVQNLGLSEMEYSVRSLTPQQLLVPGFVDCHVHAPQFPNLGLGLDRPLLEWLAEYTFPLESRYSDVDFARRVYDTVINRTLRNGTTCACYFGSLHLEGSVVLAHAAIDRGQRALVGKVSMNVPNDAGYYNPIEVELRDTEEFVRRVKEMNNDLVEPIITPRFAISCDEPLMRGLGDLAARYECKIQTHISENIHEVAAVKEMFPKQKTYAEVYDNANLLTDKCILAHAIHLEDSEIELVLENRASIAHCPASNTRLMSGLCPVRKYLNKGIRVGLGTDVSGGDMPSILDAMRRTMDVSSHLHLLDDGYAAGNDTISWKEAFNLATIGGARALSLDHKIGSFEVGKEFDALVVHNFCDDSPIDDWDAVTGPSPKSDEEKVLKLLQQFIYLGDNRNIVKVFVKGREIVF